ncbi:uracil-DNA glycosylase family protein [Kordia zhangzhouensis]|uniref:uracil-DNA glycosylase family protein n=1 Tax=Kordia zhangzhouensis TaxID=1620405 RepID=UPI000629ADCF|nr:uracil-DNA glycosylase family protein [Kordia zhangzhouensis]
MKNLLEEILGCTICKAHLPLGPNPILSAHVSSKIILIGQAPGLKVHQNGIPWNDMSGKRLRQWLNVPDAVFYDEKKIALIPMGFCYPGKGKSGDLAPRKECAEAWHNQLLHYMPQAELVLLVGQYAQKYYLKEKAKKTLTETVANYDCFLPAFFPLPHPSPRNRFWLHKNPWFEENVLPELQRRVATILNQ